MQAGEHSGPGGSGRGEGDGAAGVGWVRVMPGKGGTGTGFCCPVSSFARFGSGLSLDEQCWGWGP